jgi:hypothetical protein
VVVLVPGRLCPGSFIKVQDTHTGVRGCLLEFQTNFARGLPQLESASRAAAGGRRSVAWLVGHRRGVHHRDRRRRLVRKGQRVANSVPRR